MIVKITIVMIDCTSCYFYTDFQLVLPITHQSDEPKINQLTTFHSTPFTTSPVHSKTLFFRCLRPRPQPSTLRWLHHRSSKTSFALSPLQHDYQAIRRAYVKFLEASLSHSLLAQPFIVDVAAAAAAEA